MASGDAGSQLGPCFRRECDGNPIVMDAKPFRDFLAGGMAVRPIAVVQDVYRYEPSHPPLYYIVANLSVGAFGASEFALRLPSALFGILTIPLIFLLGKRLHSIETGLLAASMFAFGSVEVYYGQEARMYSMVLFLAVLSTWVLLEISDDSKQHRRNDWRWWAFYIATAAAGMYSTTLFVLMFVVHFAIAVERYRDDSAFLRNWFLSTVICSLLFGLFLLARFFQTDPPPSGLYWLAGSRPLIHLIRMASENMLNLVWVPEIWPYKFIWLAMVLALLGLFVVIFKGQRMRWLLVWVTLSPVAVISVDWILGTHASSVNRYYILAGPALYLLLALGTELIRPLMLSRGLALIIILYFAIGGYLTAGGNIRPRLEFKEAARFISQTSEPGDALVLISTSPPKVLGMILAYYMDSPAKMTMLQANDGPPVDWVLLADRLRDHDHVVITTIHSGYKKSPDFIRRVTENVPFLEFVEQRSYRGINVFSFRKKGASHGFHGLTSRGII